MCERECVYVCLSPGMLKLLHSDGTLNLNNKWQMKRHKETEFVLANLKLWLCFCMCVCVSVCAYVCVYYETSDSAPKWPLSDTVLLPQSDTAKA